MYTTSLAAVLRAKSLGSASDAFGDRKKTQRQLRCRPPAIVPSVCDEAAKLVDQRLHFREPQNTPSSPQMHLTNDFQHKRAEHTVTHTHTHSWQKASRSIGTFQGGTQPGGAKRRVIVCAFPTASLSFGLLCHILPQFDDVFHRSCIGETQSEHCVHELMESDASGEQEPKQIQQTALKSLPAELALLAQQAQALCC